MCSNGRSRGVTKFCLALCAPQSVHMSPTGRSEHNTAPCYDLTAVGSALIKLSDWSLQTGVLSNRGIDTFQRAWVPLNLHVFCLFAGGCHPSDKILKAVAQYLEQEWRQKVLDASKGAAWDMPEEFCQVSAVPD